MGVDSSTCVSIFVLTDFIPFSDVLLFVELLLLELLLAGGARNIGEGEVGLPGPEGN